MLASVFRVPSTTAGLSRPAQPRPHRATSTALTSASVTPPPMRVCVLVRDTPPVPRSRRRMGPRARARAGALGRRLGARARAVGPGARRGLLSRPWRRGAGRRSAGPQSGRSRGGEMRSCTALARPERESRPARGLRLRPSLPPPAPLPPCPTPHACAPPAARLCDVWCDAWCCPPAAARWCDARHLLAPSAPGRLGHGGGALGRRRWRAGGR